MAENCFHPSIEGAQHGAKTLAQFLDYAKKSGAAGAQPSNYMLQNDKGFMSPKEIKDVFSKAKMRLDGVSSHCPFWVHTSAWTGTPGIRPFITADFFATSAGINGRIPGVPVQALVCTQKGQCVETPSSLILAFANASLISFALIKPLSFWSM